MSRFAEEFIISHPGPIVGTTGQQNTAAAFYARARHKQGSTSLPSSPMPTPKRKSNFATDFTAVLSKCPPPAPSHLLRTVNAESSIVSAAKVRVILRVANSGLIDKDSSFFLLDKKKRQVTLFDPSNNGKLTSSAPKMFAFDGLYTDEDPQAEVAAAALIDPILHVVNGGDACLFCFGHASLGKTYTMVGTDEGGNTLGVIPTCLTWLFRCIREKKDRFSVRVSALEIGVEETKDLLLDMDDDMDESPPSAYMGQQQSSVFQDVSELRCPNQERASFLLDAALNARSVSDSHFVFTINVYRQSGRSRLHLIDFGCCERTKTVNGGITLSALGHVILGLFGNGQRHQQLPFRESPVTLLLKECLGSASCQATMLAHISPSPTHYSETLHTTQLASRIHRMRRFPKKQQQQHHHKISGGNDMQPMPMSSDPSSSEQSCDTVIFVGNDDDEGTDSEHPPVYLPSLNSGDNRGMMAKVLRGSIAESKIRSLERRKKSPLRNACSVGSTPTRMYNNRYNMCNNRGGSLPRAVNMRGKMPLHGRVAGYRQSSSLLLSEYWIDKQPQPPKEEDSSLMYGYMDDHKKSMIQQWVEGQAMQTRGKMVPVKAPAAMNMDCNNGQLAPEPFAWLLKEGLNEDSRVLTHFRTVESNSDESHSDNQQEDKQQQQQVVTADVHLLPSPSPEVSSMEEEEVKVVSRGVSAEMDRNGHDDDSIPLVAQKAPISSPTRTAAVATSTAAAATIAATTATTTTKSISTSAAVAGTNGDQWRNIQNSRKKEAKESSEVSSSNNNLSPVAELTESSNNSCSDDSSSCNNRNIVSLDSQLLHYVNKPENNFKDFYCNKEDEFTGKFDQLAKLHDLYASVSSISAKSQSRLHLREEEEEETDWLLQLCRRGESTFSLGAHSVTSGANSDVNSLCSEPVKMPDYSDYFSSNNKRSGLELDLGCKMDSISLSDLGFFHNHNHHQQQQQRNDSPVLEGIDQELAKYAKLKDLQQAYSEKPALTTTAATTVTTTTTTTAAATTSSSSPLASRKKRDHVPDGASSHDLNHKLCSSPSKQIEVRRQQQPLPPRRSPGTGQSSSEPEENKPSKPQNAQKKESAAAAGQKPLIQSKEKQQQQLPRTATVGKANPRRFTKPDPTTQQQQQQQQQQDNPEKKKTKESSPPSKVPKFSRLFSSATKKISRSPLKIGKEDKNHRSSSSSHVHPPPTAAAVAPTTVETDSKKSRKKSAAADKGPTSSPLTRDRGSLLLRQHDKDKCPKNGQGTPGSYAGKSSAISKKQVNIIPSPYSFPSAPTLRSAGKKASTSSNDSGLGNEGNNVKLRVARGAAATARSKSKHCSRSSGYESSLPESIDSPTTNCCKEEEEAVETLNLSSRLNTMSPLELRNYAEEEVVKLDSRWRFWRVRQLRKEQSELKDELRMAKGRIGADPEKWSYELHVEGACEDKTDPAFVEAFGKETHILKKRVDACKSHVRLVTCFDVGWFKDNKDCCTTECEFAQNMVLKQQQQQQQQLGDDDETDIF